MADDSASARPRRSALYVPGANRRALEKGRTVAADVLIFDIEDGVLPEAKETARANIVDSVGAGGYGARELVVRVNGADTGWFADDVAAAAKCGVDAILLPKTDGPETVRKTAAALETAGAAPHVRIWCMLETPIGVLNAKEIASAHPRVGAMTLGTADLSKELHAELHTRERLPLLTSIGLCILAARAYGLSVLDAPHFNLDDDEGFEYVCRRGREMGFDGKCLLHPKTIAVANAIYGPSEEELDWARRITQAHHEAAAQGKGVTLVDGKLIEALHVAEAQALIAKAERIRALERELNG